MNLQARRGLGHCKRNIGSAVLQLLGEKAGILAIPIRSNAWGGRDRAEQAMSAEEIPLS